MGWRSGLAGLALAAAAAGGSQSAEPGASYGRFEGRDYLLIWPARAPTSVLLYLHAEEAEPLAYEARSGMLEALAADGAVRGYAVLAPAASRNACGREDAEPGAERACWRLDAVADELAGLDRLIGFVERTNGAAFETRDAIGYDRGAELLILALATRRLEGVRRIGLIDAGPPRTTITLGGAAATGPLVYLEAAEGDPQAAARAADLLRALVSAGYGAKTCAQGDPGGRFYDATRLATFLVWFSQDCRRATPSPTTGAAPLSDEDGGDEDDDAANEDGASPRGRRGGPRR
jgi:hypothetical protein